MKAENFNKGLGELTANGYTVKNKLASSISE